VFWPVVLPFQLTLVVMGMLVVVRTYLATSKGRRPVGTFVMTTGLALLCFIPSCTAIGLLVDTRRFGLGHYPMHQAISNFHAPQLIPKAAREISIDKFASGHRANFKVGRADLEEWLDDLWKEHGNDSTLQRDRVRSSDFIATDFPEEFLAYGWKPAIEMTKYASPVSPRGAGFEIWYSPSDEIACQRCSYW
jgi:hypothetical protein